MTDVTIRHAQPGDADRLTEIAATAYAPYADLPGLPEVTEALADDISRHKVLVAEGPGGPRGFAVVAIDGDAAHLTNLAVLPDAGGKGLGRLLIAAAEDAARAGGARRMRLATHAGFGHALRLYARLGWHEAERDGVRVVMAKTL